ncbi:unnamed protein product (macronuclear) [Paramecium tetraurelia]|uniref:Uncharacterized protein n=1 Tax=Paramecium tetraurelia TaxID=5888 RepID=A0EFD1_PARTE|nr:uncharacterized protein GSPATT00026345001 [Paramecium tetraurelia]CAK94022.1 unnamed protein product [Paramecium tetraurelia]|eukprot:XP_001461395.1 hypothetical protein (macronuclear) [Paramecium tetraurelia strain d4-2]
MNINNQLLKIVQDIQLAIKSDFDLKPNVDELIKILRQQVTILIELVQQQKSVEYDQLEQAVQKAEAEIRNHVRVIMQFQPIQVEQQMKLYSDSLQEKIDQLEREKQELLDKNKTLLQSQERKISSQNATRESSPSLFKKSYILGNQVYNRQQATSQDNCASVIQNCDSHQTRDKRSSGTQHSYIMMKNIREKINMNASQEKVNDKSSTILKSQNSSALIKMFNIQKLIIKNQQDQHLQQLKNKTLNQILDDSQATKKKP